LVGSEVAVLLDAQHASGSSHSRSGVGESQPFTRIIAKVTVDPVGIASAKLGFAFKYQFHRSGGAANIVRTTAARYSPGGRGSLSGGETWQRPG
jgi:hypothetical protein